MVIDGLWQQRGLEAMRASFDVDGATKRRMIQFLFDEGFWNHEKLSWDAAVSRFNDCLNPGKPAFFKIGEAWALSKAFGRLQWVQAMVEDLGGEMRIRPTEERRQELLERIADATEKAVAVIAQAQAELAHMGTQASPPPLPPGTDPVRFSLDDPEQTGGF